MDEQWKQKTAGRFIVFDGPDGSGKTTQFRRFRRFLHEQGVSVCEVREPGGTLLGEKIRDLLLNPEYGEIDTHCEMLLYMASRAQLVAERLRPARAAGQCLLADRFISSTLAYQGAAGGMDKRDIIDVARVAVGDCQPDLVVVFDVDTQTAATRLNPLLDRMEQKGEAYHQKVRQGYLDQAAAEPQKYLVIDAKPGPDEIFTSLLTQLYERLSTL